MQPIITPTNWKKKNHMIVAMRAEEASDEGLKSNSNSYKTLGKPEVPGNFLHLIENI